MKSLKSWKGSHRVVVRITIVRNCLAACDRNSNQLNQKEEIRIAGCLTQSKNRNLAENLSRMTYFSTETVCKTLEFPCFEKLTPQIIEEHNFNKDLAIETYEALLKLILKSPSRNYFEIEMMKSYSEQVELAMKYAKKVFGEDFPPY